MITFYIFIALDIVVFCTQIVLLYKLRKEFTNKNASIYIGITFARIISWLVNIFIKYSRPYTEAYKLIMLNNFGLFLMTFSCAVLNIVYFNAKNKQKVKGFQLFKDKIGPIVGALLLVIYSINFLFIPDKIIINSKTKQYQEHVIEFLNEKYGNQNFKIVGVEEVHTKYSFKDYFVGYIFTVKCDSMNNKFTVRTDETGWQVLKDDYDPDKK